MPYTLMKKKGKLHLLGEKQPKPKKEKKEHKEKNEYKKDLGKHHPALATKYLMG